MNNDDILLGNNNNNNNGVSITPVRLAPTDFQHLANPKKSNQDLSASDNDFEGDDDINLSDNNDDSDDDIQLNDNNTGNQQPNFNNTQFNTKQIENARLYRRNSLNALVSIIVSTKPYYSLDEERTLSRPIEERIRNASDKLQEITEAKVKELVEINNYLHNKFPNTENGNIYIDGPQPNDESQSKQENIKNTNNLLKHYDLFV